jgi:gliding motility associated protien GldN
MKSLIILISSLIFCINSYGQSNLLNAKKPSEIGTELIKADKKSIEYPEVDDTDVLWSKVVYEFIDLNEKLNFQLLFPVNDEQYTSTRKSLWKIIRENVENGSIDEVFDVRNDNFLNSNKITGTEKIKDFYGSKYTPGDSRPQTYATSSDITGYKIKGVWFFDKKHSEMKYRLLGIQPVGRNLKEFGKEQGYFWIWYPSIRDILSNHMVFNDKNNNNRISFDDLLVNRRFSSYIYKYDNVYGDRTIRDYIRQRNGESNRQYQLRLIMESERIKKEILDFDVDMWGY